MATRATTTTFLAGRPVSRRLWGVVACLLAGAPVLAQALAPVRDYAAIDQYVLATPAAETADIPRLAAYLTRPARDDFDKARALYRWITGNIVYDVESYLRGDYSHCTAEDTLERRRAICQGYSALFQALAEAAGLEVATISGYGKGAGYVPGDTFADTNHSWSAVHVGDQWYLLDCTWGAGHLAGRGKFVRRFEEFYFLTPPAQLIYNHLPEDPKWQLLPEAVSMAGYTQLVLPRPEFFRYGLALGSHREAVIECGKRLQVTVEAPASVYMLAKLKQDDQDVTTWPVKGQRLGKAVSFALTVPTPGTYELVLYANPKTLSGTYDSVLRYSVESVAGKD